MKVVDWLLSFLNPGVQLEKPSAKAEEELVKLGIREEIDEVQHRLRALTAQADVLSRKVD